MTKIEIKTICGDIIFTHEKENNTIKDTLQEAVKNGANLSEAYLSGAYLVGANLSGANLDDWGKLSSNTDIFIAGPLGSRNAYTTFYHTDKGLFVQCGCFRGDLEEFIAKVKDTHSDNEHARNYLAIVEFVKQKDNYESDNHNNSQQ